MNIRDAILLKPVVVTLKCGAAVELLRPSALDFVDAMQVAEKTPGNLYAWMAFRHARTDGRRLFDSLEQALDADGVVVCQIGREVERLYEEGRD